MKRHFGGLAALVKELKAKVDNLEKNQDNVATIMNIQRIVDDAIKANAAAIKKIEEEIMDLNNLMKQKHVQKDIGEDGKVDAKDNNEQSKSCTVRKCRYYDRGHCKYKLRCRYFHQRGICQAYFENGKCDRNNCVERHPKTCKYWLKSKEGCKRKTACNFMHVTLAQDDGKIANEEMDDQ
jgi:antitoxin component YwqK of YwqJK toxin-antitoxin module